MEAYLLIKERNESLDCLKGIAILLVMFGHVQVHNHMTDPYLYDVIKSLQMPLFFLISGYLSGSGTKVESIRQYRERMVRRAVSYLLPFFSWLTVQHITDLPRAWKTIWFRLDYGLWFLMVLFLFTWMAYSAQLVQAKVKKEWSFWAVILGSCGLVLAVYLAGVTFLSPSLLVIYLPYYVCAYFCGFYRELFRKRVPDVFLRVFSYGCGLVFLAMAVLLDLVTVTGIVMLGFQTMASFLGCLAVIQLVRDWKANSVKSKLAWLGHYTLEIYVLHYLFAAVLNPGKKVYTFWTLEGLLYSAAAFIVMSLMTAAAVYVINHVKWLRFFLFGKHENNPPAHGDGIGGKTSWTI